MDYSHYYVCSLNLVIFLATDSTNISHQFHFLANHSRYTFFFTSHPTHISHTLLCLIIYTYIQRDYSYVTIYTSHQGGRSLLYS
ncbi:uncharacterized protein RJT20DRAFT_41924 [Scheffersomyces xylosifermentans]|uniref:uncharacterized protein n=1 Tax=Scheffersomyces xylosifermentans TaxID=1304137 RepID=UPI00315DF565